MNNIDAIQILSSYGVPQDEEQFREALDLAIASLEAWEAVNEDIDRLARRPCINQNMMAQNIAYKEVKDIVKKHLREVEG